MAQTQRGGDMADSSLDLKEVYHFILDHMDLLDDREVDEIELRASQIMWDRYNRAHPDDFED